MKPLHLGSLSTYSREEVQINVEVTVLCKSESDLFCFTDSTLDINQILDFQVELGLFYVRLDMNMERICIIEVND